MLEPYLGLLAMGAVAVWVAVAVRGLSNRLRRKLAVAAPAANQAPPPVTAPGGRRSSTSRYFLIAVVGFMFHAGSFYFYLWGASAKSSGLVGLMVMLGVGMCLIVGVFYSWARGVVAYAIESDPPVQLD